MIHSFDFASKNVKDVGKVTAVNATLVKIEGFAGGVIGEGISFETGVHGRIISIHLDTCEAVVFSNEPVKVGSLAARTGEPLSISVGGGLLTHVITPLGYVIDERRQISKPPESREIDVKPQGIATRKKVSKFLLTGVPIVDLMVPVGEGQRELVIGNRKCGKTFFILSTLITQARLGKICVLGLIAKKKAEVKKIERILEEEKVIGNCVIVASFASDSPGEVYLTPYSAMTVAEYFRDQGKDVLVTLDDMTTHAKYYRERSLLAGMFPGRESYPGDIFHIQSKLLERAGNFIVGDKTVSITCLPVAETLEADLTGYIQTNLMSMTDGHIFFDSDLFFRGIRPAVNIFLSVTRVGHQTQPKALKELSQQVLRLLKKMQEFERFLRFGPEVTDTVKETMNRGEKIWKFFKKDSFKAISQEEQVAEVKKILEEKYISETPEIKAEKDTDKSKVPGTEVKTEINKSEEQNPKPEAG